MLFWHWVGGACGAVVATEDQAVLVKHENRCTILCMCTVCRGDTFSGGEEVVG